MRFPPIFAAAFAFFPAVAHPVSVVPRQSIAVTRLWQDECQSSPGYVDFKTALQDAVRRHDAAALRKLFSARGQMRINGLDLRSDPERWSVDSVSSVGPWTELERLLPLGCWRDDDRLLIPYVARYVQQGILSEPAVVAVKPTSIFRAPNSSSPVLRRIARGAFVQMDDPYAALGWASVRLVDGRKGFVHSAEIRSSGAAVLKLAYEGGHWRIVWFGGYD